MLNHCKNNAIHYKINDISIAWMLNHCKNNVIQCKINDICIAWMLNHCKNNAIHYKINDICIAWMLNHCRNNAIQCKINDICIAWMLNHCKTTFVASKDASDFCSFNSSMSSPFCKESRNAPNFSLQESIRGFSSIAIGAMYAFWLFFQSSCTCSIMCRLCKDPSPVPTSSTPVPVSSSRVPASSTRAPPWFFGKVTFLHAWLSIVDLHMCMYDIIIYIHIIHIYMYIYIPVYKYIYVYT